MRSLWVLASYSSSRFLARVGGMSTPPGVSVRAARPPRASVVSELVRQRPHLGREALPIAPPGQRPVQALRAGAARAERRLLDELGIVPQRRVDRPEAGEGRLLGVLHGLDGLVVGAQAEPLRDLAQVVVDVGQELL